MIVELLTLALAPEQRAGQRIAHKSWPMHKAAGFAVTDGFQMCIRDSH